MVCIEVGICVLHLQDHPNPSHHSTQHTHVHNMSFSPGIKSASFPVQKTDFTERNQLKKPHEAERKLVWWKCGKRRCDFLTLRSDLLVSFHVAEYGS